MVENSQKSSKFHRKLNKNIYFYIKAFFTYPKKLLF